MKKFTSHSIPIPLCRLSLVVVMLLYVLSEVQASDDFYFKATLRPYPAGAGKVYMYMTIKVSKKKFVEDLVNEITKDTEMRVRFNEQKFREDAFKVFEKSNEEEYNDFKEQH